MNESRYLSSLAGNRFIFSNYHFHDSGTGSQNESIGYLIKGSVKIKSGSETISAGEGQMIYIPKGEIYESHWYGAPDIEFYSLRFNFQAVNLYESRLEQEKRYKLQSVPEVHGAIKSQVEHIFSEGSGSIVNPSYKALGEFYLMYDMLTKCMAYDIRPIAGNPVREAVEFIERNISLEFDVAFLARLCSMSESAFYESFKKTTGYTPIEYKNRVRVQKAVELLADSRNTVEMISRQLNFSTPSYFRRIFKKYTGTNPGDFRARNMYI